MKQAYLIFFALASIILSSSCESDPSVTTNINTENLIDTWFRSYPNLVWGGHNSPPFERGETHIRITFQENGDFIHNRTVLGLYEGQSIEDTTAVVIESGTYSANEGALDIVLDKRIWWDSFYDDLKEFEESGVHTNTFMDASFEILNDDLNLTYFTKTDLISEEQETPGIDKFEEVYTKE